VSRSAGCSIAASAVSTFGASFGSFRVELVADAGHGEEVPRRRWVLLDLLAQPVHELLEELPIPRRGSVFTPISIWRTSSGSTIAAERMGWFDASVGTPPRLRPTGLKPVE
jgi:hypothetical protein